MGHGCLERVSLWVNKLVVAGGRGHKTFSVKLAHKCSGDETLGAVKSALPATRDGGRDTIGLFF